MYSDEYKTVEAKVEAGIEDRGWSFQSTLVPAVSVSAAQTALKAMQKTWAGDAVASHVIRIGLPAEAEVTMHSDEESVDAAKVLLNLLEDAELTHVLLLVVKMPLPDQKSTSASERAYHDAGLNAIQRAKKVVRILYNTIEVIPGHENIEFLGNFIQDLRAKVVQVTRGQQTTMTVKVRASQIDSFKKNLQSRYPKIEFQSS